VGRLTRSAHIFIKEKKCLIVTCTQTTEAIISFHMPIQTLDMECRTAMDTEITQVQISLAVQ